jgi:hypothetical protein
MGNMAASARKWSKEISGALELNDYNVRKMVGTFNVMLLSMGQTEKGAFDMSTSLTQLAYDMASFYNITNDEAFIKLQTGLAGETEPLKRLGIMVDENTVKLTAMRLGLIKQGETMSQAQKVIARYLTITEATSKAQGDLARTMDSPANMARRLKENFELLTIQLGQLLIPAAMKVIEKLQGMVAWLKNLNPETQKTILKIAALAAVLGPLMIIISSLITAFRNIASVIALVATPTGLIIAAIAALIGILIYLYNTNEEVRKALDSAWRFLSNTIPHYIGVIRQAISDLDNDMYESIVRGMGTWLQSVQEKARGVIQWFRSNETMQKWFNPEGKNTDKPGFYEGDLAGISDKEIEDAIAKYKGSKPKINIPALDPSITISGDLNKVFGGDPNSIFNGMLDTLKDSSGTVESMIEAFKKLSGAAGTGSDAYKQLTNSAKQFVKELETQTQAFSRFVGIFDKVENNRMSESRMLIRMRKQFEQTKMWYESLRKLEPRLADSPGLMQEIRGLGPSYAKAIRSMAGMSDANLAQYKSYYSGKEGYAAKIAYDYVKVDHSGKITLEGINFDELMTKVIDIVSDEIRADSSRYAPSTPRN